MLTRKEKDDMPDDLAMGTAIVALLDARDKRCTHVAEWLLGCVMTRHALEARLNGASVAEATKMIKSVFPSRGGRFDG